MFVKQKTNEYMKLTAKAIEALSRSIRMRLALELNFTEAWIDKLIDKNKNNGPLTTTKALEVMEQETRLLKSQILEEVKEPVK